MKSRKPSYLTKIFHLKNRPGFLIPVKKYGDKLISLRVLTMEDMSNNRLVDKLSSWRRKHSYWFGGEFKITRSRTKKWIKELVVEKPDRILFVIEDQFGKYYGHLGFNRYRSFDNSCELDNVVRGEEEISGLMTDCVDKLVKWGLKNLPISKLFLITFGDNQRAINLYRRNGFKIIRKIPLALKKHNGETAWEVIKKGEKEKPGRFYVRMKYFA